ncbi:hypothetical protein Dsin_000247 [Dipteronia sinensis]|uniref:RNase H type-1 domain-containing protein n=1 Tax=Dipteronia sinensis TaxID=43782 RepID=A0AAE0EHC5_9ROSI|nr:hypothetical protein Dsin_000247 [Dipteronia sinensis]
MRCNDVVMGIFPAYLLFTVTMRFIWRWTCKSVFANNFKLPVCAGKIITNFVDEWLKANSDSDSKNEMKHCLIAWSPPKTEWVKLNVDGSLNPDLGTISAGGVIRNHKKKWIGGVALNRGNGSIIEAELWGIFEGLQLMLKVGFKKVVVETDSQSSVSVLSNNTPINHPLFSIIHACKALMDNSWCCSIGHVYREGNRVVDSLAKLGHSLNLGITIFDDPPSHILGALEDDFNGLAVARLVLS